MNAKSLRYSANVQTNCSCELNNGYPIDFFDLTMVFSGKLHYEIDGKDIILKKNDVILIPPGSIRIRHKGVETVHYMSLNYYSDGADEKDIPLYIPNCHAFFKETMLFFDRLQSNTITHKKEATDYGLRLLIELLKNEVENQNLNHHVHQILEYISLNLTHPITLDEIAESVYLSVPYCCHLVKKELGCTISEIITRERVALAQQYLVSGAFSLKDIPFRCGFTDYSHFYKCFKKYTGISPSKYKA